MARDPNERRSSSLIEKPEDMPPGVVLPSQVKTGGIGSGSGQYYAYRVIYADGRSEIEWYKRGSGGGPDQPDPVELRTEAPVATSVKSEWEKGEKKEEDTAGKKEVRKYPGTDPGTGLPAIVTEYSDGSKSYDSSTSTTTGQKATVGRVEGTPTGRGADGQMAFDNSKPIWVERDASGQQVGPAKPLTADQRQQWEREKNGGKSDDEIRVDTQKDDTTVADVAYVGTGKARQKVTTYKSGRKVTEAAPTDARAISATYETRDGKPVKVTKYDDNTETIEEQKPTAGQVIKGGGPKGEDVQAVVGADGKVSYQPIAGARPKGAKMPPGVVPPSSFTYGTAAQQLADFQRQLNEAVSRGDITGDEATELFAPYHAQADTAVKEQQGVLNTQRGIMQDETTQRGQDLETTRSRGGLARDLFNTSISQTMDLNKYVNPGSDSAGRAALAMLKLGKGYVEDMGGLAETPRTQMLPAVRQAMEASLNPPAPNLGASAAAATGALNANAARLGVPPAAPAPDPRAGAQAPAPEAPAPEAPAAPAPAPAAAGPLLAPPPAVPGQTLLPGVQAAMTPQYDPDLTAGSLLSMGFDPDVVDGVHQQRYGRSLFGRSAA